MSTDDRVRDLVKGVALALAEIERLLRSRGCDALDANLTGLAMIEQERDRQVTDEGYRVEFDDQNWTGGQLADAAACYLMTPETRANEAGLDEDRGALSSPDDPPHIWPWEPEAWKPHSS